MAKVKGQDVVLNLIDGAIVTPIACARSITFDISNDLIETSITGSGNYRTYKPGALQWSGTIEGLVFIYKDTTNYYGLGQLYDIITSSQKIVIQWYEEDIDHITFLSKAGEVYIESINEVSSFDNMVTFTANFKGTGQIYISYGDI